MTDFPAHRNHPGDWTEDAACREHDPALWFPSTPNGLDNHARSALLRQIADEAIAICNACPVRRRCLEDALNEERKRGVESIHGIFGGLGPDERRRLIKKERSDVA